MDWVSRFLGLPAGPKKSSPRPAANDPETRLARFKRTYHTVLALCNRPRNLSNEGPLLDQLKGYLDRLAVFLREETRAPAPHLCIQFSNSNHVYALAGRTAVVSQHEGIVFAAVNIFAALVESEEEDFLASGSFAKSLMRLVTRVVDNGARIETETSILELLFTITAKIRLQPTILGAWFQHRSKEEQEEVSQNEKKNFVGLAQKEDFPLCYLLIDRVHHEGRIGDFARTGLLYIFEATGRSRDLEAWILSSDLPTLMATGLGALYSQLSRELSILHPDVTIPPVLAMSDYNTTHPRAAAESAFSDRHQRHLATFLSHLAFWQDVLNHCRSDEVKESLLDHLQILFLQQLLYPSLLQSSDTDAGSSVAVLTYLTAALESLEYPDLIRMMLTYLLAISDENSILDSPWASMTLLSAKVPRSPKALRRRQSLMLLTAPERPDETVDPNLFNLVDLILNNVASKNSQSVYAALKLAATIISKQKSYAFGTLLKVQAQVDGPIVRTVGALHQEAEKLLEIASSYHTGFGVDNAYNGLCEDVRIVIEAQDPAFFTEPSVTPEKQEDHGNIINRYTLQPEDALMRTLNALLKTFWTNSVDVNLALTQAFVSIATCVDIRLDGWLVLDPASYEISHKESLPLRSWEVHLDSSEAAALESAQKATKRPTWPKEDQDPTIYKILGVLKTELDSVRASISSFDNLISARKSMLQATSISIPPTPDISEPPSRLPSPIPTNLSEFPRPKMPPLSSRNSRSGSPAPASLIPSDFGLSASPAFRPIFQPPPPETANTTDFLMQTIIFPKSSSGGDCRVEISKAEIMPARSATLNHVLTNAVVLQEFVLELAAVCTVRAAVLGEKEVLFVV